MTVHELASVLYKETPVEICVDFVPVFTGVAEDAKMSKYFLKTVKEIYIDVDGVTLVVSIDNSKIK